MEEDNYMKMKMKTTIRNYMLKIVTKLFPEIYLQGHNDGYLDCALDVDFHLISLGRRKKAKKSKAKTNKTNKTPMKKKVAKKVATTKTSQVGK